MNNTKEVRQGRSVYIPELKDLGMSKSSLDKYKESLTSGSGSGGCYYITGPNGCGKTTTLYSTLIWLGQQPYSDENKIMTIEDNALCFLEGVAQTEGDPGQAANYFKSILRSDPDTIMIDSIESASDTIQFTRSAIESAKLITDSGLTGHKVLAPLSTNTALNFVSRLQRFGVENFLIGNSTKTVVNQRLLPTLCENCKEPVEFNENLFDLYQISAADYKKVISSDHLGATVYRINSNGCSECFYRGIQPKKDRTGVFEVIVLDDELRDAIVADAPMRDLTAIARRSGSKSLFEESLEKVYSGLVDPGEAPRLSLMK